VTAVRNLSHAPRTMKPKAADFHETMERFALARSMLAVCHRSLLRDESATAARDEADVLAEAIEKLRQVYDEFDLLDAASPQRRPPPTT
jgi:hypothetical protein